MEAINNPSNGTIDSFFDNAQTECKKRNLINSIKYLCINAFVRAVPGSDVTKILLQKMSNLR